MATYKIDENFADYRGCGKVWAAIDEDDNVVGLRYMGECPENRGGLPAWVRAVASNADGRECNGLPSIWSSKTFAKMAKAAEACDDCPKPPRKERYRPSELLTMARAAILAWDQANFSAYRERCRQDLSEHGRVVSGMCSCFELVIRE